MAGIFIRHALFHGEPEIECIAGALGLPSNHVVGCFARIWSWADEHVRDLASGKTGMPGRFFDQMVAVEGFMQAAAQNAPTWVKIDDERVVLLSFERHNGKSAKARAADTKRKQRERWGLEPRQPRSPAPPKAAAPSSADAPELPGTASNGKAKAPRPSKRCPVDFQLPDEVRVFAVSLGFTPQEIEFQFGKMKDQEFRFAHSHWDATARNWFREAAERKGRGPAQSAFPTAFDKTKAAAARVLARIQEDEQR